MSRAARLLIAAAVTVVALILSLSTARGQQVPCPGWSALQPLFDGSGSAEILEHTGPNLVVDARGQAHLAWLSYPQSATDGDRSVYYYSRWDGVRWTQPVDILAASDNLQLGWPVLVAGPDGRLHLFWSISHYVFHSWAWAELANSAQEWTLPEAVIATMAENSAPMDVKLDSEGVFHLVFTTRTGDVQYTHSPNGDVGWMAPVPISAVPPGVATFLPRIAVAPGGGAIHVVWTEFPLPEGSSLRVNYARSIDGGATWTNQQEFGGQFTSDGNVLVAADGVVYVAWNGGVGLGGRYLRWSNDAGVVWSDTLKFSERIGQAGFPGLAVDSVGTLHILTGDGEYSTWNQRGLSPACEFSSPSNERSRLAVVAGNQVLVVIPTTNGLNYAIKDVPVAAIPTSALSMAPPPLVTPDMAIPVYATEQIAQDHLHMTDELMFDRAAEAPERHSPILSIVVAAGLSTVIILLAVVGRIRFRRL